MKMKKTLKFALLAAVAVLSSTSAWAQGTLHGTTQYGTDGLQYKILSIYKTESGSNVNTVSVSANVYGTNGKATITIPATVSIDVKGTDDSTPTAQSIDEAITFKVVAIEDNAFKNVTTSGEGNVTAIKIGSNVKTIGANAFDGCTNVTSITFDANTNDMTIADDAFKGTKPTALDLTPTAIKSVGKWFGDYSSTYGTKINETLESVTFPASLTTIAAEAFAGFKNLETVNFTAPNHSAVQTIGDGAFAETAIANLDLTKTNLKTLNPLFENETSVGKYNVNLNSITLPSSITTLEKYALGDCIQLSEVTFSTKKNDGTDGASVAAYGKAINNLTTIESYALGNTIVSEYDFSDCVKLESFATNKTPFVTPNSYTNKNLTTVTLPLYNKSDDKTSHVSEIGIAFANLQKLTTVNNLNVSKITDLATYAFANDPALESLSFPATLVTVSGSPFAGDVKLAKLTFDGTALNTLGDGTSNLYAAVTGSTVTNDQSQAQQDAPAALAALTTLNITGKFDGTIKAAAFAENTAITAVSISAGTNDEVLSSATIEANAIKLSNEANSTVTIGGKISSTDINAQSIAGPTSGSYATTLVLGEINAALATVAVVDGNIASATVGKINASIAFPVEALGQTPSITFAGEIAGTVTNSATAPSLTSIDFGSIKIAEGAITTNAFDENTATNLKEVTWKPADADAKKAFDQKAFGTSQKDDAALVTLHTTTAVAVLYADAPGVTPLEKNLYNIIFEATAKVVEDEAVKTVTLTQGGNYYWGVLNTNGSASKNYYINQSDDDHKSVVVYSAFVDGKNRDIYIDPLARNNERFIVAENQTVIVRATTSDAVVNVYETTEDPTMRYTKGGDILNDLLYSTTIISSDDMATANPTKDYYRLGSFKSNNGIAWGKVAATSYIPAEKVYVLCEQSTSEAGLRVIFLDGSEDVSTLIEGIQAQKPVDNGAIYNLQGIRVDASYKGIVIKNGKKYLQK